jgi:phage terminase small subunit
MSSTSRCGGDRVANGEDTFPKDGLPSRPVHFTPEENEFWTLLLRQIPNELLRTVDAHQLQSLCENMAMRNKYYSTLKKDPLDKTVFSHWMRCVQQIARLSPVFGLGPIDRRRMKLGVQSGGDDADDWENES